MKKLNEFGVFQLLLCCSVLLLVFVASCSTTKKSVEPSAASQDGMNLATAGTQDEIYDVTDTSAEFPGGQEALLKYIKEHVRYPAAARKKNVQGIVMLRFSVERDGSIGEIQVTRSLSPSCDKHAVRVVRGLPKFKPAMLKGRPVRQWINLPLRFSLQ